MAVNIRRATKEDARAVAEFAIRLFAQHHAYDTRRFANIASVEGAENFYGSQTEAADAAVLGRELMAGQVDLSSHRAVGWLDGPRHPHAVDLQCAGFLRSGVSGADAAAPQTCLTAR